MHTCACLHHVYLCTYMYRYLHICIHAHVMCMYVQTYTCQPTYIHIHIAYIHTSESHEANTGVMASHDQKSKVAPHYSHLDLRNAVVPLTVLLASGGTSANGVTWPQKSCCNSFISSLPEKCNGIIDYIVNITWYQPMASHDQKSHVAPHYSHLDLRNAMVPLTMLSTAHDANTVSVASHDQKIMLHFISIALT